MISLIQNRVSDLSTNYEKAFIISILRISRDLHCMVEDVLNMPIPQYIVIVEDIVNNDRKRKNGKFNRSSNTREYWRSFKS